MSLSEELGRLGALHERGVLSDGEFARAKARVLGGAPDVAAPALLAINALRRSRDDRRLGGVCGGIARVTGAESWIWRHFFRIAGAVRRNRCAGLLADVDPDSGRAADPRARAGRSAGRVSRRLGDVRGRRVVPP